MMKSGRVIQAQVENSLVKVHPDLNPYWSSPGTAIEEGNDYFQPCNSKKLLCAL